jgi:hypothetical protein
MTTLGEWSREDAAEEALLTEQIRYYFVEDIIGATVDDRLAGETPLGAVRHRANGRVASIPAPE